MTIHTTTKDRYDAIVVGLGSHGSACLYHLAKAGAKVLGIERWGVSHSQGSHHGLTRITRMAYQEGPQYVPLLRTSFDLYRLLEQESGQVLYTPTGVLNIGNPGMEAALATAVQMGLEHEVLSWQQVNERFPGYQLPSGYQALYEASGGILAPEKMVAAHVAVARDHGAQVQLDEQVLSWEALANGGARVTTSSGSYEAAVLVLAAGAWMPSLVPELQGLVTPCRVTVGWFEATPAASFRPDTFPVFIIHDQESGVPFYGFPEFGAKPGVKLGAFQAGPGCDPDALERSCQEGDEQLMRRCLSRFMPAANGALLDFAACMFTMTPDGHFVIDRHPRHPQVILCSACSGHGFKLSPAVGQILARLALGREGSELQGVLAAHRLDARRPGVADALARFAGGA